MESLLYEQRFFLNAIESVSNHAFDLAEKAKSILAAFDAFILPQPKYPELTEEDIALCLQYESEYHQIYNFYRETEKVAELQERQYKNIVQGKILPLIEKPFGYFGLGYEIRNATLNLNKILIDTVFSYFDKTYGLRLDEPKKEAVMELIGDSRSSQTEKLQELNFDMLYAAIKEHLDGHSFDEAAEQKIMESFRSAIREGSYDVNAHQYVYNGALKLTCEKDKVVYQSGHNLGIGQSVFKGERRLEDFFLGLSKYESGKGEMLECFKDLCTWDGCKILYNVVTPIKGSEMVKTMEIYKKGKFKIAGKSSEMFYMEKAAKLLKPAGILAVVVPMSFLSDEMTHKHMIEAVDAQYSFIVGFRLSEKSFAGLGVSSYATKVLFFYKRTNHAAHSPFDLNAIQDISEWSAERTYSTYLKPVFEQKEKVRYQLHKEALLHRSPSFAALVTKHCSTSNKARRSNCCLTRKTMLTDISRKKNRRV